MKLFEDKTPLEKIDLIEKCMKEALPQVKAITSSADILDVWDYWMPYLIKRVEYLESLPHMFGNNLRFQELKELRKENNKLIKALEHIRYAGLSQGWCGDKLTIKEYKTLCINMATDVLGLEK